jgi:hypothetical protein
MYGQIMSHCTWLNIRQNENCFAQKQSMLSIVIILRQGQTFSS